MFKIFFLLSGLLQSLVNSNGINNLQPVATVGTVVTDQRLAGSWNAGAIDIKFELLPKSDLMKPKDSTDAQLPLGDTREQQAFLEKCYAVTLRENNAAYVLVGSLTRINNQLYMDLMPLGIKFKDKLEDGGLGFSPEYLTTFNIARISLDRNGSMSLQILRGDFIKEQVLSGRMMLKHVYEPLYNSFLVTASSFELHQFLEKYGHDERFFEQATVFTKKGS